MLSTDTTWEVVQSFLNVPGMKGVALIDGRSRPYFQGIERVLNSQQREALAQGVWQVLETIPDDFESFEFQFAGTQVYIHKLSQDQILLVLTHDNLIYPDYFDAFSRLREAFTQDSSGTMDVFQRLLGARNTKATPLNLSDVANGDDVPSPVDTLGAVELGMDDLDDSDDMVAEERLPQELPTLEIPSGSADYAVAADTEITDISTAAVEPDAPANPVSNNADELQATVLLDPDDALDGASPVSADADDLPATVLLDPDDAPELPDFSATDAGLPDLDGAEASLPDIGGSEVGAPEAAPEVPTAEMDSQAGNAAALFAASLADANALVGRNRPVESDSVTADALPDVDSLLAVNQPPAGKASGSAASSQDQADLAELVDTLSLGEEDFDNSGAVDSLTGAETSGAAAGIDAMLPDMELPGDGETAETLEGLPDVEGESPESLNPWDEPDAAAAVVSEALEESQSLQPELQSGGLEEPLLAVTQSGVDGEVLGDEVAERSLNNRLDAVALDDDIEIDDLFGYEEPVAAAAPQASNAVLESYVESLNALGEFSAHYLGRAVIVNYWRTSRPGDDWLQGAFAIERSANSIRLGPDYAASRRSPITDGQEAVLQTWAGQFVSRCSKVIRDFPQLAQQSLSEEQSKMLDL